jgi:hypothetical protein
MFGAELSIDGEEHTFHGLTDLILNATPNYAGSWVLDRLGEPDDGLMEMIPIRGHAEWVAKGIRDHSATPIWKEHLDLVGINMSKSRPEDDERTRTQVDG